ncbi:hypothetical protein HOD02_01210 [bacterium]|jgi:hypothetical protein|nr:hypothetical protein [bacterium]
MTKEVTIILSEWVHEALIALDGRAHYIDIAKMIWKNHGKEIQEAGDLLFTWQYDYRWAGTYLRDEGIMSPANVSEKGIWELKPE